MKNKNFVSHDSKRIGARQYNDFFDFTLQNFLKKEIYFKDKRRNPQLYEVVGWEINPVVADDFTANLFILTRTIKYKQNERKRKSD